MNGCPDCARFPADLEALVGWSHVHDLWAPCWWFVREVYRRHLGVALPIHNVLERRSTVLLAARHRFARVRVFERYALVFVHPASGPPHVGLWLAPGEVLHLMNTAAGVCRSRLSDWQDRGAVTCYRWTPSA